MYDVTAIKGEGRTPLAANAPLADAHELAKHAASGGDWDRVEVRDAITGQVVATHVAGDQQRSPLADLAIAQYRNCQKVRRQLYRAEDQTLRAALLVPIADRDYYFEQTEKIRLEMDAEDEREYNRSGHPVIY